MLNACRHHCDQHFCTRLLEDMTPECSTPVGIIAISTASRPWRVRAAWSAQRLSASLRSARHGCHCSQRRSGVLNACRHHCDQHCRRPALISPGRLVLNACRHHCDQHRPGQSWRGSRGPVLNACRHHCDQHLEMSGQELASRLCSTPVGIIAISTTTCGIGPFWLSSAQRLSASLRSARLLM